MPDPAPDPAQPSAPAEHIPWDSIGGEDETSLRAPGEGFDFSPSPGTSPEYAGRGPSAGPDHQEAPSRGGAWTIPLLCAGLALIACCVLIPQADANRRLAYERELLRRDLQTIDQQIDVNAEFLKKVADDPELAQRLAERQMKVIPEGVRVLDLTHESDGMSPFQLLSVAPPPSLPPYKPTGGTIAHLCYGPHSRLYLIGISLGMIAMGLVLGAAPPRDA